MYQKFREFVALRELAPMPAMPTTTPTSPAAKQALMNTLNILPKIPGNNAATMLPKVNRAKQIAMSTPGVKTATQAMDIAGASQN